MADSPVMPAEMAAWEVLTTAARSHAEAVIAADLAARLPSAEPLMIARKAIRNMTLPPGQQMAASPMVRLLRLVDRWAVMNPYDRRIAAAELRNTAAEAAQMAGFAP